MIVVMPELTRRQRTAALVAAWLAGTVLVVALGIQAVAVVSDSVTEARPAPLSAAAVRRALTEESGQTPSTTAPATGTTQASTATTRSPTTATTRPPTGGGPGATTTTRPTGSTGPTATTATTPVTGSTSAAEDRTYDLVGGSVGVRFENGTARLLWATPTAGFRAERHGGGDEVDIRFRSDTHESRLRAYWDNGPRAEVEERPDS
jgi:hypothetical protein